MSMRNEKLYKIQMVILAWTLLAGTFGCAPEFAPWQTNIDAGQKNANAKQLAALESLNLQLPYTVGIIGDPQGTPEDLRLTVKALNRSRADFVLLLGDLTNFALKDEFIATFEELEKSQKPLITVIGNHDGIAFGRDIYAKMFGPFDFSFRVGGIKYIMWNNCKLEFGGDNNLDWLEAELEDSSIVGSHIEPIVDVHTQADIDRWLQMYEGKKVVASLHGHRGSTNAFLNRQRGVPVYVVAKVDGVHYGLLDIDEEQQLKFSDCRGDRCTERPLP